MDETNGTQITSLTADVGSGTWDNDISGVTTNGSGSLVSSGSVSGTSGLDITDLTSGIYEFTASDVVFNNIGGSSEDTFAFGFRSGSSTTRVGTSGTFDSAVITVGNINGSGTLDAITRTDGTNRDTVNDFASISGTYSFTVQYDLDSDEASFFYDSGSGRNQIGSTVTSVTGAANYLAFSYAVTVFGGGSDNIEVGGLTLTQVPEPSAYAFLTGLLALGWIAVRRRR